jgi:cleavage and polyadenylation specificity factor subunit 1
LWAEQFAEQSTWRSGAQSAWDPRHPVVVEVAMVCLGSSHLLPHLVVLLDNGDLLLYRGFKLVEEASPTLPLRFKRLEHNVLCRNFKTPSAPTGFAKRRTDGDSDSDDEEETKIISTERHRWTHSRIVQIAAIEGRRGAFISGMRPIWILAERDYARTFKMDIDGAVSCFTEFNNINCPDGFVYYASQSVC